MIRGATHRRRVLRTKKKNRLSLRFTRMTSYVLLWIFFFSFFSLHKFLSMNTRHYDQRRPSALAGPPPCLFADPQCTYRLLGGKVPQFVLPVLKWFGAIQRFCFVFHCLYFKRVMFFFYDNVFTGAKNNPLSVFSICFHEK